MSGGLASCLACGGELEPFGAKGSYEYRLCAACGSLQLFPEPSAEELNPRYRDEYAQAGHSRELGDPAVWNRTAGSFHQAMVDSLRSHVPGGLVIDYGCGWGGLLEKLARDERFEAVGLEPSQEMARYCASRGAKIAGGDLSALAMRRGEARAILLCGVFEHLTGRREWLLQAHELLAPGGVMISLQPSAAFFRCLGRIWRSFLPAKDLPTFYGGFAPPWHTALLSHRGMEALAQGAGFELVEIRRAPQRRAPGPIMIAQAALDNLNKAGWAVGGKHWPLVPAHIYVLRNPGGTARNSR